MHTITEVAARLRVSERTVYRLLASKDLAPVKVRRSTRISEESVLAYLAGGRDAA